VNLSVEFTLVKHGRVAVLSHEVIDRILHRYKSNLTTPQVERIHDHFAKFGGIVSQKADLLTEWVIDEISKGYARNDDLNRFAAAADFYFHEVRTPKFKKIAQEVLEEQFEDSLREGEEHPRYNVKNILQFSLRDIEDIEERYKKPEIDPRVNDLGDKLPEGSRLFYNDGTYQIVEVMSSQAACQLSRGTKWCTSDDSVSQSYLDQSPLYVIYQSGRKIGQLYIGRTPDSIQFMDLRDREITPDISFLKVLIKAGLYVKILIALAHPEYEDYQATKRWLLPDPEVEEMVATNGLLSVLYAHHVLNRRFPKGEPEIAKSGPNSYVYFTYVLKHHRFKMGEPAIIFDNKGSRGKFLYAYMKLLPPGEFRSFMEDYKDNPDVQSMYRASFDYEQETS
jgi:hypothetical protein